MAEEVAKRGSRFIQIRLFKLDCYSINSSPPCGVEGSVIGNHQMAGYRWCYTFYLQLALEEVLIVSCGAVLPPHENTTAKTCPAWTSLMSKALLDVREQERHLKKRSHEKALKTQCEWMTVSEQLPEFLPATYRLYPGNILRKYNAVWVQTVGGEQGLAKAEGEEPGDCCKVTKHITLCSPTLDSPLHLLVNNQHCPLPKAVYPCWVAGEEAARLETSASVFMLLTHRKDIWMS